MHRISHEGDVKQVLLDKERILVTGWGWISNNDFLNNVRGKSREEYTRLYESDFGRLTRNRFCLYLFLNEFKKGDYVVVPGLKDFSVYKIVGNTPNSKEDIKHFITSSETKGCLSFNGKNYLRSNGESLELGFFWEVEPVELNILRDGYADNKLQRRLKFQMTLLGQSIRQYDVPEKNYHISQAAKERWDELSNDCIRNYWYRKQVKCDKLTVAKRFKLYKGSEKEGKEELLNPGDPLVFRQMFHEEHTIPVSLIMNELTGSSKISTMKDIEGLLDSMHISILLKDEDRDINAKFGKTNGRSLIFSDNVKNIYNKCGITLLACPRLP